MTSPASLFSVSPFKPCYNVVRKTRSHGDITLSFPGIVLAKTEVKARINHHAPVNDVPSDYSSTQLSVFPVKAQHVMKETSHCY